MQYLILLIILLITTSCKKTGINETSILQKNGIAAKDYGPIGILTSGNGEVHCVATAIAPNVVITAAHCLKSDNDYTVKFVSSFLDDIFFGFNIDGKMQYIQGYEALSLGQSKGVNDVGLLALRQTIPKNINYYDFDVLTNNPDGEYYYRYGKNCQTNYSATTITFTKWNIPFPDTGACKGDSGGSLIFKQDNKKFVYGVVSGGSYVGSEAINTFSNDYGHISGDKIVNIKSFIKAHQNIEPPKIAQNIIDCIETSIAKMGNHNSINAKIDKNEEEVIRKTIAMYKLPLIPATIPSPNLCRIMRGTAEGG